MKKITIALLLCTVLCAAVFAQTAADFNVTFTKDEKGVVITGYTGTATAVKIPATIQGMPVREIGEKAFWGRNIISVVISEGVTIIRKSAFTGFSRDNRDRIQISDKLVQVTLPSTLRIIEDNAFSNNPTLKSIVIPEGVTEIGNEAFNECYALASVTLPKSLAKLGASAFFRTAITSITLHPNLTKIVRDTFAYTKLTSIVIPEGVTEIINEDVSLAGGAFRDCVALTSVTLPSTIQKIGRDVFRNCSSLTTVNIPASVEAIDIADDAFSNCGKLSLASQSAIKKRKEAWVVAKEAAREAAKQTAEAERAAAREAERVAREKEQADREAERENARKAQQTAREEQEAAEKAQRTAILNTRDNLFNKAKELSEKIPGYGQKKPSQKVIYDLAKEYYALVSEVEKFKEQYPQIGNYDFYFSDTIFSRLNNIRNQFQLDWFSKKELAAFDKEFPGLVKR